MRTLDHGMLLRAKNVMDDALPELEKIRELVPEVLHERLDKVIAGFEDTLCTADVSDDYEEKSRYPRGGHLPT
jgi:hypothetical protein